MKLPTVKYPSGREVSLAAFLLRIASLESRRTGRISLNGKRSGAKDAAIPSFHHQKEQRHEHHSFQGEVERIQR